MIRITICAYDKPDNVGGPVSWIRRLLPLLRDRGIEARCLFIMHYGETGPALSSLLEAGFECRWTALDRTEDRIRWILDDLAEHRPDIFVPNLVVAAYFAARWAREAGIPTVGILHSDDKFYRALQSEFISGAPEYQLDAVVCVSKQLADDVNSHNPSRTIVRRIPYGISIPGATVSRSGPSLRLAYSGRLAEEQKRITDVVRALALATKEIPQTTASIFGDGPDRRKVARLIESEFGDGKVVLEGLVDSEQMQNRMLSVDVIVLLSDYEGLPIALLEAMACGCVPVCLRGRSGIPELVTHNETGLLVDDRGTAFVAAIRRLSEEVDLWPRLSHAARERSESFSAESSADEWAALLKELSADANSRAEVAIPDKIVLPPVHPDLGSADRRVLRPRRLSRIVSRSRMILGRWKRALFK